MVAVTVGERNAPDRGTGDLGGVEQRVAAAGDSRVDEREAVVLAARETRSRNAAS